MTLAWMLIGAALAGMPMGSRGSLRLAELGGRRAQVSRVGWVRSVDAASIGRPAAIGLGGLVAAREGPALGVAVALAIATGASLTGRGMVRRRVLRRRADAVVIVQLVHAELEAGADPATAVEAADGDNAFGPDLVRMAQAMRQARDPTIDAPDELRSLAHALRVGIGSGAPTGPVLDAVRNQLQAELDRIAAVTAALAGVRAAAVLLALLPAVGLALGAGLGVNPVRLLFLTPAGHTFVLIGVSLECAGLCWTARMAAAAEGLAA